jgi:hypothetical protein
MEGAEVEPAGMKSTDELFSDEAGRDGLQYAVGEALHLKPNELQSIDADKLRDLFSALPEPVRAVAYEWGLGDIMFMNNARLYIKHDRAKYLSILGLMQA